MVSHALDAADGEDARWRDGEVPRNDRWYVRWDTAAPEFSRGHLSRTAGTAAVS